MWSRLEKGLGTTPTAKALALVAPCRPSDELLRKWYSEDYTVSSSDLFTKIYKVGVFPENITEAMSEFGVVWEELPFTDPKPKAGTKWITLAFSAQPTV